MSEKLAEVIRAGGFDRRYVADLVVDGQRVLEDVALPSCELKWDGNAKIRCQGRAVFEYSSELGDSIVPEDITSWLTPYASFLNLSMLVSAGGFQEKVLLGTLKVVGVSDPRDLQSAFQERQLSVGSRVTLSLADGFVVTDRERFPAPSGPQDLSSVWAEIGRLTAMPLLRGVPDRAISRAVTYKENRLDAVFDLASILDGRPFVNENGQVSVESDVWPAASEALTVGREGTITTAGPSDMTDEGVFNQIVVRGTDDSAGVILDDSVKVTEGPLRYGGPFGRIPYFASSQFVTDYDQAHAYALSLLPSVSRQPAVTYTIQCVPDPRRQVGDVIPFTWNGRERVGRVRELTLGSAGPMTLKVLVQ